MELGSMCVFSGITQDLMGKVTTNSTLRPSLASVIEIAAVPAVKRLRLPCFLTGSSLLAGVVVGLVALVNPNSVASPQNLSVQAHTPSPHPEKVVAERPLVRKTVSLAASFPLPVSQNLEKAEDKENVPGKETRS